MEEKIKDRTGTKVIRLVFLYLILYISYLTVYMSRQNLSVATPILTDENNMIMSALQIGTLGTVFSIVYSVGRLINGRIGDKIKPKYMLMTGLLLIFASNIGFGFFLPFVLEAILWGINAFGQSMLWGPILRTLSASMPPKKLTRLMSIFATSISMGTVTGILLCTGAITFIGVEHAFFVPAAIALVMAILSFIFAGKVKFEEKQEDSAEKPASPKLKDLLKNKLLLSTLIPTMFQGVMKENVNLWLSLFFVTKFSIDLKDSTVFVFVIPLIGLVGRLIYPFIYNLLGKNEFKVNILAFGLCALGSLPVIFIPSGENAPLYLIILASLCLGIISAAISIANHSMLTMIPLRFAKLNSSSTAAGIIDFMSYIGAALGSIIYGWMFDMGDFFYVMFISWIVISAIAIILSIISDKKKLLDTI